MAKLILVDNYNREIIADKLIEEGLSNEEAKRKADEYNTKHKHGEWFAKAVVDEYKLWEGIQEFI